jgi:lysophospholipase L1-like esterase
MRRLVGAVGAVCGALLVAVAVTPASAAPPLQYVALGDSYSAGFGLEPFSATSPFAATPSTALNGCYQAEANYPHLVAASLGLDLQDRTCSGAVTANVTTTPQLTMTGQTAPTVQAAALSDDTDIVTISIGGNDLGFATVATDCIRADVSMPPDAILAATPSPGPTSCQEYYTAATGRWTGQVNLQSLLDGTVKPALAATFAAIAASAPNARVFVVGYPQISTSDAAKAATCYSEPLPPGTNTVPFAPSDLLWLSTVEQGLDDAIRSAAEAQGDRFTYVSSWSQTADNTLCDGDDSWITKITITYPSPPDAGCDAQTQQTLSYDGFTACLALGALHPNAAGVASLHERVVAAIGAAIGEPGAGDPGPALPATGAVPPIGAVAAIVAVIGLRLALSRRGRRRGARPGASGT